MSFSFQFPEIKSVLCPKTIKSRQSKCSSSRHTRIVFAPSSINLKGFLERGNKFESVSFRNESVLWDRHKKALLDALEKIKISCFLSVAELMILSFISLLLTFGENYILKICIPSHVAHTMLPCPVPTPWKEEEDEKREGHRKLLCSKNCENETINLISAKALHQLHILIFFLAILHVLYSFLTMMLGRLKMRGWKHWEKEKSSTITSFQQMETKTGETSRAGVNHSKEFSFVKPAPSKEPSSQDR
ncbi:hypothetical protein EUTSA_v10022829mg [Eutrema salsugineum]|uniref:MLO-like protein n=1 Tax=Eutrema salsugineum TaxID=72664 RepID=V4NVB5_EUTSA|nr:hypothetical protein EUTSA_v10022829mg [Eutrema salsugineum]